MFLLYVKFITFALLSSITLIYEKDLCTVISSFKFWK